MDLAEFTNLANDAKKKQNNFSKMFVFKSKSTRRMEKAHVQTEREKLKKLEQANKLNPPKAKQSPDLQTKPRLSNQVTSHLTSLISYINSTGLSTEGLYRVPGSKALVDDLEAEVLASNTRSITNLFTKSGGGRSRRLLRCEQGAGKPRSAHTVRAVSADFGTESAG